MTIQTDDIAAFLAVVREGSFGRAASSLLVSQPAVSDRMARLEHEVGGRLFHRTTRGATLTPAGDAFCPTPSAPSTCSTTPPRPCVRSMTRPACGVAVHATFAHRVVPLVLRSLERLHRSVKVRDAHSDAIIAALLDGACDAGFIVPGARPRQLRFVTLPPDPVVAVVAPSHPLAGGQRIHARPRGSPGGVQPFRPRRQRVRRAIAKGGRARMELDRMLRHRHRAPSGDPRRARCDGDEVAGRCACRPRRCVSPGSPATPSLDRPAHLRLPEQRRGRSRHCCHPSAVEHLPRRRVA